ncbi:MULTISPECIES: FeoA family protein [unclassified Polaromonas]|jgi:ferrous iron transport protein A|uniref:FeoA family protein n=1 Tax=unclassified Polaromonas TaxID=2638319 RepID=UPI0018CB4631|nr:MULTISPECIES: FeoA family protein [unclassified Polaromonas]MBG6071080.1 ferrous iron transport protein A [Polaromonas sp. CG_9.7]MBG6113080.1 ferrous iron transport protein A [Polaromonas sp. CG_9.2]MDH6185612.1 ferrous iron transport protein A [Polaromonas sp. CG_23.6]
MTLAHLSSGTADIGLDEWPQRLPAQVLRLMPPGDEEEREVLLRLLEIGFLPGEPVQVMARGFPGNDPLAVRVGHTTFALRSHEAALIRVGPLAAVAACAA